MSLEKNGSKSSYYITCENTMSKIRLDYAYEGKPTRNVFVELARGERESLQLIVVSDSTFLKNINVELSALVGPKGILIKSTNTDIFLVKYVEVKKPTAGGLGVGVYPDPLVPYEKPFDVLSGSHQSLWFTFYAPYGQSSGIYKGSITLNPSNADPYTLDLTVKVYDFDLPRRPSLRTSFWLNSTYIEKYYGIGWKWGVWNRPDMTDPPIPDHKNLFSWMLDNNTCKSGTRSICIEPKKNIEVEKNIGVGICTNVGTLKKGKKYLFRVWYKTGSSIQKKGIVRVCVPPSLSATDLAPSEEWKLFEKEFLWPSFQEGSVYLASWGGMKVWFDSVELKRLPQGENLIPNHSFEIGNTIEESRWPFILNMLEHRISPINVATPTIKIRKNDVLIDWEKFDLRMASYVDHGGTGFNVDWIQTPSKEELDSMATDKAKIVKQVLQETEKHLCEKGWGDLAYKYLTDEPSSKSFPDLRSRAQVLKEYFPHLKILLTLGYGASLPWEMGKPGLPAYAELEDFLDIWVPHIVCFHKSFLKQMHKAGKQIWTYDSISSKKPYANIWATDYPGVDHRVVFWGLWTHYVTGFLYWGVSHWRYANPWENALTFPRVGGGNGDGSMLYPGESGPINSIRWDIARDGIEDFDYLSLLNELVYKGEKIKVSPQLLKKAKKLLDASDISASWTEYTEDPLKIIDRRSKIAQTIEKLQKAVLEAQ
jgi:hypothetical protein